MNKIFLKLKARNKTQIVQTSTKNNCFTWDVKLRHNAAIRFFTKTVDITE